MVRYLLFVLIFSPASYGSVLSEGWHKISVGGTHSGYLVYRYEFEEKTKQFKSTSYIRIKGVGGDSTESLRAVATKSLVPISYQYTFQQGKQTKLIDATFKDYVMSLTRTVGGKAREEKVKLEKGTFLGTFLYFLILNNKEGLKVGNNFSYVAIAEEDARVFRGEAFVKEVTKLSGFETFKILNSFKNTRYVTYLSPKAEVVKTSDPVNHVESLATNTTAEAAGKIPIDQKSLKILFKTIPQPLTFKNISAGSDKTKNLNKKKKTPGKGAVPAGKGIQVKGKKSK